MKTLGDTGLMPKERDLENCPRGNWQTNYEVNGIIDQISALSLLEIVKKAVELGLIVIERCEGCCGTGDIADNEPCSDCSGSGDVVEEGE